jgi:hypothetical protein
LLPQIQLTVLLEDCVLTMRWLGLLSQEIQLFLCYSSFSVGEEEEG